jgi:hypothetical protein
MLKFAFLPLSCQINMCDKRHDEITRGNYNRLSVASDTRRTAEG